MSKPGFGYLCDFRNPPQFGRDWQRTYAETLDFIAWSETAGFSGVWVPEHHGAADGYMPSPMIALAAIAARTSRMTIGSGIALGPLYHPVRFAEDCAVLDLLSGGRLEMGLAIGYRRRETDGYGVDFTRRGARFDAFLDIVTRLWAGETVSHDSPHFSLTNARVTPLPVRGSVPLFVGGFAPKALARVARYGSGYFGNEEFVEPYRDALRAAGKDADHPRIWLQGLFLMVAEDPDKAMSELAPSFHHVNNVYGEWLAEDKASGIDNPGLAAMDLDAFKKSGILTILTPDQAIAHFRALSARVPVEQFAMMLPPGISPSAFQPYAETFATKVMPFL